MSPATDRCGSSSLLMRVARIVRIVSALSALTFVPTACHHSQTEGHSEIATRFIDALNTHDPDRVIGLMTADGTFSDPVEGVSVPAAAFRNRLQRDALGWKDRVYSIRHVVADGDSVAIEWHIQQTHPSGEAVPLDGITILKVQDGRIKAARFYYNALVYLRFFGKH